MQMICTKEGGRSRDSTICFDNHGALQKESFILVIVSQLFHWLPSFEYILFCALKCVVSLCAVIVILVVVVVAVVVVVVVVVEEDIDYRAAVVKMSIARKSLFGARKCL